MRAKLLFLLPALAYTLAITYLSLINLADTPVSEMGVSDKLLHGGAYFGMALLWLLFVVFTYNNENFIKIVVYVCLFTTGFGIFIEVLQKELTDYRQLDIYDIFANSVGAILAGLAVYLLKNNLIGLKAKINSFLIKN
ncbi:membrane protein [Salinimicrobium marinum]|uniref:Membrane protein n=1 Tax=Salinimicrobium marinum TaxID=680283 RepID=A0A918S4P7_9FLAO|nr:VanZ family protein [Salinimicrobium marinum]GHA24312.1 membrane protein [Salinimicrobium marinum]